MTSIFTFVIVAIFIALASCNNGNADKNSNINKDSGVSRTDTSIQKTGTPVKSDSTTYPVKVKGTENAQNKSVVEQKTKVEVHYFHVTNRCPSCIAIESATKKTLDTYFKNELKNGTVKFYVFNVDDNANKAISDEYQAFGSSLFVTRIADGKKTKTDLTGEGFKYAKNKEEKFIGILKEKIDYALKP